MRDATIRMENQDGKIIPIETMIANDPQQRAAGYQYICPDVIARTTMLFRYAEAVSGRFHMNNVRAPLEIGFFDSDGMLMRSMVMRTYSGDHRPLYGPGVPFQYALEAPVGFFQRHGLVDGATRLMVESLP